MASIARKFVRRIPADKDTGYGYKISSQLFETKPSTGL
jgi:hypothetical protein